MKNNNIDTCFICSRGAKIPPSGFCGQKLKELRIKNGVSLLDGAVAGKMMKDMLWNAEEDNEEPHPKKLDRLAEFYGVEKESFYIDVKAQTEKENKLIESALKRQKIILNLKRK